MREQGVYNPLTGENITGEYASSSKEELATKLKELKKKLIEKIVSGKKPRVNGIKAIITSYYNSLKQPVNNELLEKRKQELKKEVKAYSKLYDELIKIGEQGKSYGLSYEVTLKPSLSFHLGWQSKREGLWLQFKKENKPHSLFYALPLTNIKTNTYGPHFIGGLPAAARLILVTKHLMLFTSHENQPPSDLIKQLTPKEELITDLVPMLTGKKRGALIDFELTDPECVDCPAEPPKKEIINTVFKEMPRIKAVGIVTSGYPEKEVIVKT